MFAKSSFDLQVDQSKDLTFQFLHDSTSRGMTVARDVNVRHIDWECESGRNGRPP